MAENETITLDFSIIRVYITTDGSKRLLLLDERPERARECPDAPRLRWLSEKEFFMFTKIFNIL